MLSQLKRKFPLKEYTTIKIGGWAELFFTPSKEEDIIQLLPKLAQDYPLYYLGGGSNTIFGNFKGVVVYTGNLKGWQIVKETYEGVYIEALAGTPIKDFYPLCVEKSLFGLEMLMGIPRITIGGAVAMNAGAYGREISSVVEKVTYFDPTEGVLKEIKPQFGYRSSPFPQKGLVLKVLLKLEKKKESFKRVVAELSRQRREKQPLSYPTAGSTFKNPPQGYAGKLLQEVGLKGFCTKNGLCFSEKHANFLVNRDLKATFDDVLKILDIAKERVFREFGIVLQEEVKIVGN
jgi:UDP-N-acetylmuramate dehydrogenase